MKIKKIFTSVIAGAALLIFAGAASAATYTGGATAPATPTADINIYGASAQYTFWKTEGPIYLQAAGCSLTGAGATADGKNFIQEANCGGNVINLRVSSKASYDGPLAVDSNGTHPSRDTACAAVGNSYRKMIRSLSDCTAGVCTVVAAPNSCKQVTIGASDVAVNDFVQFSQGALLGPLGGAMTIRNFASNPFAMTTATSFCQPQGIAFSFFVNSGATTGVKKADGSQLTDITTAEAKMIFSGAIKDWADMQHVDMTAGPVTVCLRHAGSGTHAAMDGFMRPQSVVRVATGSAASDVYHVFFNDGSSDLMRCVNGSGAWSGKGAIGYADSDQILTSYPNTVRISIDGIQPTTANVDDYSHAFTSIQQLYGIAANTDTAVYKDLCIFANLPSTIAAVNPNWSAQCNMKHVKDSVFGNFKSNTNYHNANCL